MGFWRELGEGLAQAVYPENLYCMACNDIGEFSDSWGLCEKCLTNLFSEDNLRGTLMKDAKGRSYSRVLACTVYGGLSKEIIGKYKNKSQPWLGKNLGKLMAERFAEEERSYRFGLRGRDFDGTIISPADLVTFVPMHPAKKRIRGYDQAQLMAEQVARSLRIPCVECLERTRKTAAMKNMSEEQRNQNVSGAFAWREPAAVSGRLPLSGKHMILVDDIVTTGSTAEACASVLRRAGAKDVTLLAFAAAAHQSAQ
ncbi:MAG: ComF family protein [Firmicutes bacterium]|nr:ComF family protein [Bacillota bacterium]